MYVRRARPSSRARKGDALGGVRERGADGVGVGGAASFGGAGPSVRLGGLDAAYGGMAGVGGDVAAAGPAAEGHGLTRRGAASAVRELSRIELRPLFLLFASSPGVPAGA